MSTSQIAKNVLSKYLGPPISIDISQVKECNRTSQSRADDVSIEHVQKLMASIQAEGQKEPITVQQHRSGEYQPIDGNGRLKAMKELGKTTIKARVLKKPLSASERISLQLNQNNHDPRDPNKRKDIIKSINELLACGFFANIHCNQQLSEEIDEWYKETMPGSTKRQRNRNIQAALNSRSTPSSISTFKTYINAEAVEFVHNNTKFTGRQGEIVNQEVYYLLGIESSYRATFGSIALMKSKNPNVKITLFVWDQNTVGKNNVQINNYRTNMQNKVKSEINGASYLKANFKLVDNLYYLPQLKGSEYPGPPVKMTL